uniref:Neuroendocrine protein 7B2 n=1 Tax=Timema californicum TaxID=61474 RepID=A0A7R9P670_TIMCA|nr:unnamed protein product [Timema californicum]
MEGGDKKKSPRARQDFAVPDTRHGPNVPFQTEMTARGGAAPPLERPPPNCVKTTPQEHFLTDALLREVVDRMGKDLADAADSYLDFPETNRLGLGGLMPGRSIKDLEAEEQQQLPLDYDPMVETGNNPSIRDQEYLQHSSLWGHQYMTGGAGEGKQHLKPDGTVENQKEVKTDAALPAYCNPPNPCPVGYSADDGCLEQFENTAAFRYSSPMASLVMTDSSQLTYDSFKTLPDLIKYPYAEPDDLQKHVREYQAAQECMCDTEHMFDCPVSSGRDLQGSNGAPGSELTDSDINRIMEQFQVTDQHKSLVAKKFHVKKVRIIL